MEVHHHPQVEKKRFREYFLEFLMIFLAVTLGFFAEGLREHINDRSKEKEYIVSLKKDLTKDVITIHTWIASFSSRITDYDSLIGMLRHPQDVKDGADMYYFARLATRGTVFEDNNATLIQLNVAGNFRLISKRNIAEKIIGYEDDINNYKRVNGYDVYEASALYQPESKLFDAFVFNDMSKPLTDSVIGNGNTLLTGFKIAFGRPAGNPKLLTNDKDKINDMVYYLHQRRSTFAAEILVLHKQKGDAEALIDLIRKEYGL